MGKKTDNFIKKLSAIVFCAALLFPIPGVLAQEDLKFKTSTTTPKRFTPLEFIQGVDPSFDAYIHNKSLNLDLKHSNDIRIMLDTTNLNLSSERFTSISIHAYELVDGQRDLVSIQNLSISKRGKKNRIIQIDTGEFTETEKTLELEIYDSLGELFNTYRTTINAYELDSQVSLDSQNTLLPVADCDHTEFGDCHMEYIARNFILEAAPQKQASTRITKKSNGKYHITVPYPRGEFQNLSRKIRRKKIKVNNTENNTVIEGNSLVVEEKPLVETPVDGLIERFDGNLYFTVGENRVPLIQKNSNGVSTIASSQSSQIITQSGQQGPMGPIGPKGDKGDPGDGSFAEFREETTNYTLTSDDYTLAVDASGGAVVITLPTASTALRGKIYHLKKTDTGSNIVTVDAGSDFIDGTNYYNLAHPYESIMIQCTGSKWLIL